VIPVIPANTSECNFEWRNGRNHQARFCDMAEGHEGLHLDSVMSEWSDEGCQFCLGDLDCNEECLTEVRRSDK
jgi:hypothetical protein